MLKMIYRSQKYGFSLISMIFLLTCSIVTIPTYFHNELYYVFAFQSNPFYFWQAFSGIFEHSIFPSWFLWAHFLGNMSILIIFGILIERLLGSKKMMILTLSAGIIYIAFFQIRFYGETTSGSGASGIVYAYAPLVFYILYVIVIRHKNDLRGEKIYWLLVVEFIFMWGAITAVQTWNGTNIYHFVATLVGICFVFLYKSSINKEINYVMNRSTKSIHVAKEKWLYIIMVMPLFVITIYAMYFTGKLNALFVEPAYISEHSTIDSVRNNNGIVEIKYESSITKFNSVYTSGFDSAIITYSEDGKIIFCEFPDDISHPCTIILKSAFTNKGQVVRDVVIEIK